MEKSSTGSLLLVAGGAAGVLYLSNQLLRARRKAMEAEVELASREAAAVPPKPPKDPAPPKKESAPPKKEPPAPKSDGITREFDPLFERFGLGIPVPYLRALAKRESDMNPAEKTDPAWGLLQVIEAVRLGFNQWQETDYTRADLLNPEINVRIVAGSLRRIIESYARNHPQVPNLAERWDNPRFVELVTFGWNAGFSEKAGVGKVVTFLEAAGIRDVTIDVVHEWARGTFGASPHLLRKDKVAWCKSVTALYYAELARDQKEAARPPVA
jgi:hypothetical protein